MKLNCMQELSKLHLTYGERKFVDSMTLKSTHHSIIICEILFQVTFVTKNSIMAKIKISNFTPKNSRFYFNRFISVIYYMNIIIVTIIIILLIINNIF